MRKLLLILGLAISIGGTTAWVLLGANTGWTKTRVMRTELDPITEIEQPIWDEKFLPGVDFLVTADVVGGVLIVASLLGRKKKPQH